MSEFATSPRSMVRRVPKHATYARADVLQILDEAWICHVGVVDDGAPVVIPMSCWVHEERLLVHGSPRSRLVSLLRGGAQACVTVTHLDGLVLARSAFHHSMNYRSVILHGAAKEIVDVVAREVAFRAFVEKVAVGRWDEVRQPSRAELRATTLLSFDIDEAAGKVRQGGPTDAPRDLDRSVWAGVVPLVLTRGEPVPDDAGIE
jgi:uncharacterized protein